MISLIYWTGVLVMFLSASGKLLFASNRDVFRKIAKRNNIPYSIPVMLATFGIIALCWPGVLVMWLIKGYRV